jgi:hypothetical protein
MAALIMHNATIEIGDFRAIGHKTTTHLYTISGDLRDIRDFTHTTSNHPEKAHPIW